MSYLYSTHTSSISTKEAKKLIAGIDYICPKGAPCSIYLTKTDRHWRASETGIFAVYFAPIEWVVDRTYDGLVKKKPKWLKIVDVITRDHFIEQIFADGQDPKTFKINLKDITHIKFQSESNQCRLHFGFKDGSQLRSFERVLGSEEQSSELVSNLKQAVRNAKKPQTPAAHR